MKLIIILGFLLVGCASDSGVVSIGQDTFKIYHRNATGLGGGSESVKSDVMLKAADYCASQKKSLRVTNVIMGNPPYIFGNFPKAEVQFKCLDAKELELAILSEKPIGDVSKQNGNAQNSGDMYTELKKLKELLDTGVITQSEFDTKKTKILNK